MKKKHIRTLIICAFVLLAAVTAIFNFRIEPAEQPSPSSVASLPAVETEMPPAEAVQDKKEETEKNEAEKEKNLVIEKEQEKEEIPAKTSAEGNNPLKETDEPDKKDAPAVTQNNETKLPNPDQHFCTIEIRCDTVVDTSKLENQAVAPYVPKSGVILKTTKIQFSPGENVFDILLRATKERNIHMEFRDDNLYSGKYIEGINYLYEMDGGPLSGWMYKVNGRFPNYGCAACEVEDGDVIVWMYTCDLGVDVGDNSTW